MPEIYVILNRIFSQSLKLCNVRLVCINVLPLGRQRVTLNFTFDVQPQGGITCPRTPSSGNGHARHGAAIKWSHRPWVRGFTGTLSKVCFRYLQDRSAARIFVAQTIPFLPAVHVSKRPVQAGLRQMGLYQRHNHILYAGITLKTISNSRYVAVHRPVALTVMAGVHKSFKNSKSRVKMMTWSKMHTEDPFANTGRKRTKFSRSDDRDSCASEWWTFVFPIWHFSSEWREVNTAGLWDVKVTVR